MSKRRLRRKDPDWQRRLQQAEQDAPAIMARCRMAGLMLEVSEVSAGRTRFPHWRFVLPDGFTCLHYWPTSGATRTADGVMGRANSPDEAFEQAMDLVPNGCIFADAVQIGEKT